MEGGPNDGASRRLTAPLLDEFPRHRQTTISISISRGFQFFQFRPISSFALGLVALGCSKAGLLHGGPWFVIGGEERVGSRSCEEQLKLPEALGNN